MIIWHFSSIFTHCFLEGVVTRNDHVKPTYCPITNSLTLSQKYYFVLKYVKFLTNCY